MRTSTPNLKGDTMIGLADRWQFYKDRIGQWQWRKFLSNKVVAVSADGFRSRQACVTDAKTRGYVAPSRSVIEQAATISA